ncbi:nucleotidyltransferase-like protein [Kineococcus xinjiangensis]|uniref:Nucleotidyltransferase-like protein n=1 Tax=Kineococcus xinjiangensis TaxID=512762 RepID=A0A2S6IHQ7_9ACTN|nr:nucleotidyltransferase-like protein [Kineococcus xinjiangensis]
MHLSNPLRSVTPTVDADVLLVLVQSYAPLTGAGVHRLAGRSYAQVRACLHRLVAEGLVTAAPVGSAVTYRLNRQHVLARPLLDIAEAARSVEQRLRARIEEWTPAPELVAVFGSWARGEADAGSGIDLLVLRSATLADDEHWSTQVDLTVRGLEELTGNDVQVVALTRQQFEEAVRRGEPLIANLRADARVLSGPELYRLPGRGVRPRSVPAPGGALHPRPPLPVAEGRSSAAGGVRPGDGTADPAGAQGVAGDPSAGSGRTARLLRPCHARAVAARCGGPRAVPCRLHRRARGDRGGARLRPRAPRGGRPQVAEQRCHPPTSCTSHGCR